ncbi:hypothetical protein CRUP_010274, partial [Coryphaenoides rupestris]
VWSRVGDMTPRGSSLFFFILGLTLFPVCLGAHGSYAQKLLSDLFSNYNSALRPVEDTDHIINVTLQITLSQIIDMDERNQILTTYLWNRQIANDQFSSSMETNVVLRNDGQVMWDQPAITKSSCSVDVAFFPFDVQQCRLTFGSWTHNGNQMDLVNALDSADLVDFVPNVEWEVLGMPSKKNVILYGCCSEPYPDITFSLNLKRRSSFYIFNLLIPCMMISFLAPLGFYLPADSGEKVSLGVTVLLALTVFQLLVAESMPPSESVPLIGKYYIATMTMITASTALTIFIMNIHHCGPEARPIPEWARRFILDYLARVCFVYEMGDNCLAGKRHPAQAEEEAPTPLQEEEGGVRMGRSGSREVNGGRAWTGRQDGKPPGWEDGAAGSCGGAGGQPPPPLPHSKDGVDYAQQAERTECQLQGLRRDVELIASCYQEQRSTQRLVGEWRKVAKVMDRFFMWLFFIMVFFMSLLIMGKAV